MDVPTEDRQRDKQPTNPKDYGLLGDPPLKIIPYSVTRQNINSQE
jgi:hypothetical protein